MVQGLPILCLSRHETGNPVNAMPSRSTRPPPRPHLLLADGSYDGPTTITASDAPTFEDIAAIASELTGRTICFQLMAEDDWVAAQVATGRQELMARYMLGMYDAASQGYFAVIDPLLAELLGREPRSVRNLLTPPAAR